MGGPGQEGGKGMDNQAGRPAGAAAVGRARCRLLVKRAAVKRRPTAPAVPASHLAPTLPPCCCSSKLLNQAFGGLVHAASTTITELELELSGLAAASPARSMPAKVGRRLDREQRIRHAQWGQARTNAQRGAHATDKPSPDSALARRTARPPRQRWTTLLCSWPPQPPQQALRAARSRR